MSRLLNIGKQAITNQANKQASFNNLQKSGNSNVDDYLKAGANIFSAQVMAHKTRIQNAKSATAQKNNEYWQRYNAAAEARLANKVTPQIPVAAGPMDSIINRFANNPIITPQINTQQMNQNRISPKAFSNQSNIEGVFGQANNGTFTRTVGSSPLMQMTSQGYIPPTDPTNPTEQNDVNAIMASGDALSNYGQAQMPPIGVQQPITPTYDLNAQ